MTGADLRVEVRDQDIIITMPDTSFRVVYRKPNRGPQPIAVLIKEDKMEVTQGDNRLPVLAAEIRSP